jgi:hypothetical protein
VGGKPRKKPVVGSPSPKPIKRQVLFFQAVDPESGKRSRYPFGDAFARLLALGHTDLPRLVPILSGRP